MPSIVWKGHLTFGLISIPVKLFRAARRERVPLHYVHRRTVSDRDPEEPGEELADSVKSAPPGDQIAIEPVATEADLAEMAPISRLKQSLVSASDDQPIRRDEIFRGYEVEPDRYVVLNPEELRGLRRRTSPTMEIVRSVKLAEIDPVFFETSYYVEPGSGGEKAYAILFAGLRETGRVALARVGMHGREHVMIVRPGATGLLAHTMFYTDEIRFKNEFLTDVQSVAAKELELAKTFLQAIEAPFAPEEFKDAYRGELQALIAQKTEQAPVVAGVPPQVSAGTPVVDIIEALKKSIAKAKTPVLAEQTARKGPGRMTESKNKRQARKAR